MKRRLLPRLATLALVISLFAQSVTALAGETSSVITTEETSETIVSTESKEEENSLETDETIDESSEIPVVPAEDEISDINTESDALTESETETADVQKTETEAVSTEESEALTNENNSTAAALSKAAPEPALANDTVTDSSQLNLGYFTVNYGQTVATTSRTVSLNDDPSWNWTDDPSRVVSYCTLSTFYSPLNNQEENNGFLDYILARNIVSSSDPDGCNFMAGTTSHLYDSFTDEIIAWGEDLNWSEETEIKDLSAKFTMEIDYLDANGEPADFLTESAEEDQPYWDISFEPQSFSSQTAGELTETASMLKQEYDLTWDNSSDSVYTLQDIGSIEMHTGTVFRGFNPDYTGVLQIRPVFTYEYKFTVDGQSYDITLYTPDCTRSYDVVKESTEPQYVSASDSDLKASVTHDGVESSLNTESDKVTAVQHGDEITYQIDASSEAEAQVFYHYYLDMYPLGDAVCSDTVLKKLSDIGAAVRPPFFDSWIIGDVTDYLVFELTIPEGLTYDESQKDNIELEVDGPDFLNWSLDDYKNRETVKIVHNQDGSTTIQCIATLKDYGYISLQSCSKEYVYSKLNDILNEKVTLNVPGITVSENAKAGTYYTAKARVYGSYYCLYEYVLGYNNLPVMAKPSVGDSWDADFGGWDEEAEQLSVNTLQTDSQAASWSSDIKLLSASSDTDNSDDPELNEMFPYPPDDSVYSMTGPDDQGYDMLSRAPNMNYSWDHLQNAEGRDVIQSEEEAQNTKELWYTVVIPAATISKDLPDDASEDDLSKEYTFGIQLKDENLFGLTFSASRGVKQDDGTVSYSSTNETVEFDETGYAEITLKAGEVLAIGLPDGCEYNVKEILEDDSFVIEYQYMPAAGDETVSTGTYNNNPGIDGKLEAARYTESDSVDIIDVTGRNFPTGSLSIAKRLIVPEEDLPQQSEKEFQFVLTLSNDDVDVNNVYTAKLYTDGVYNESLGAFEYSGDPDDVTVTVADGKLEFSLKHGETLEIDGLPMGTSYTVEESESQGFTPTITNQTGTIAAHIDISVFCENNDTGITVNKIWTGDSEDTRPNSVQMQLYKNGQPEGDPVTLTEDDDWSFTWNYLEAEQTYTVEEVNVPNGYTDSVTHEDNVWTVTNTKLPEEPETTTVTVNKIWKNDDASTRPDSVQIQLKKNGEPEGDPVTLSDDNGWSYSWNALEAGQEYTVEEVNVPDGYEVSVAHEGNVWTVTNTKKPAGETTTPTETPEKPTETPAESTTTSETTTTPETTDTTSVNTGDTSSTGLWLLLTIFSASLAVLLVTGKRKTER